jgi:hypothetical protein
MSGSVTSVFSEPNEFQAALRPDGVLSLLVTGHGQFRARLTQVTLTITFRQNDRSRPLAIVIALILKKIIKNGVRRAPDSLIWASGWRTLRLFEPAPG